MTNKEKHEAEVMSRGWETVYHVAKGGDPWSADAWPRLAAMERVWRRRCRRLDAWRKAKAPLRPEAKKAQMHARSAINGMFMSMFYLSLIKPKQFQEADADRKRGKDQALLAVGVLIMHTDIINAGGITRESVTRRQQAMSHGEN